MVQHLPERNSVNLKTEAGSPSESLAQTKSITADHTMGDKLPVLFAWHDTDNADTCPVILLLEPHAQTSTPQRIITLFQT